MLGQGQFSKPPRKLQGVSVPSGNLKGKTIFSPKIRRCSTKSKQVNIFLLKYRSGAFCKPLTGSPVFIIPPNNLHIVKYCCQKIHIDVCLMMINHSLSGIMSTAYTLVV